MCKCSSDGFQDIETHLSMNGVVTPMSQSQLKSHPAMCGAEDRHQCTTHDHSTQHSSNNTLIRATLMVMEEMFMRGSDTS